MQARAPVRFWCKADYPRGHQLQRFFGADDRAKSQSLAHELIALAGPILLSNLLQAIVASSGIFWVARLVGSHGLAAVAATNAVVLLVVGVISSLGACAAIFVARARGASDSPGIDRAVLAGASLTIIVSALATAAGLLVPRQVLISLNTPPEVLELSTQYMRAIACSLPMAHLVIFLVMVSRGLGDARKPLYVAGLIGGLDFVLLPLFIGLDGAPFGYGLAGVGLAAMVSQSAGLAVLGTLAVRRLNLRLWPALVRSPDELWRVGGKILKQGLAMAVQPLVLSSSMTALTVLVNAHGSSASAAYAANWQLWSYCQMPALAIAFATSTLVAAAQGRGQTEDVRKILSIAVAICAGVTATLSMISIVSGGFVFGELFRGNLKMAEYAAHINLIVCLSFTVNSIGIVIFGVFRAYGLLLTPIALLFISAWGVRYGFAVSFVPSLGLEAVWWSFPVSAFLGSMLALSFFSVWAKRALPALKS